MAENKKITLHPIKEDGTMDMSINLCPKTLSTAIVDEHGEPVSFATVTELSNLEIHIGKELLLKADKSEIPTNYVTTDTYQNISGYKHFSNRAFFNGGIGLGYGVSMYIDEDDVSDIDIKHEDSSLYAPIRLNLGTASRDSAKLVLGNCDKSTSTYSDLGNAYIRRVYKELDEFGIPTIDIDKAYLLIPNKGTKQNPETLATISDCGTKLYLHTIKTSNTDQFRTVNIVSTLPIAYTQYSSVDVFAEGVISIVVIDGDFEHHVYKNAIYVYLRDGTYVTFDNQTLQYSDYVFKEETITVL